MSMHDAGYKQRKEEFVSNLSGTSHWEVFLLTTSMSLLICMGTPCMEAYKLAGGSMLTCMLGKHMSDFGNL
eukprot:365255-Chlamydomonas_euryale.AAC.14